MSSSELLVGVIGLGNRGALSFESHRPGKGSRLVAGADVNEKQFDRLRDKFGKDFYLTTDYRQLLARKDVDAVFITSPDGLHEEHAVAALEAGKAVFLEKPMAITVAGCDRILATAHRVKKPLYVGHNMRHMPVIRKMKELIDAGAIGKVKAGWCRHFVSYGGDAYYKDWHAERKLATGLLLQKGAHDIDVLHWLTCGYSKRVSAMGGLTVYGDVKDRIPAGTLGKAMWDSKEWPGAKHTKLNHTIDVEDISMMLMELDNGVFCSYQQCHYTPDAWRNYTIIGDAGRLENFGDAPGESVIKVWNKRGFYKPDGDEQHEIKPVDGGHGGADPVMVSEFLRFAREGGKTETSAIAARYSVAAGCQATDSLRNNGAPRDVPPVDKNVRDYFERGA